MALWKASAIVPFPLSVAWPADGSMPAKFEWRTRIPTGARSSFDGYPIWLGPYTGPQLPKNKGDLWEPGSLETMIDMPTREEALEPSSRCFELVIDDLAFQIQQPLVIAQLELIDLTAPVAVGDERPNLIFPFPEGYRQWKFAQTHHLGNVQAVEVPTLRDEYIFLANERVQNAIDWYLKGLHQRSDADQFISYWIALEVLRAHEGTSVEEPARLRCTHEIHKCPICDAPTSTFRQRASIEAFLNRFGVDGNLADRLWSMRQIVHGAKTFRPDDQLVLGELTQALRAVVVAAIKAARGQDVDGPPIVTAQGPGVGPIIVEGLREVAGYDFAGVASTGNGR